MKTLKSDFGRLLGIFFALVLLPLVSFCQPAPPPMPAAMIDRWILAQPNWLDTFSNAPLGSANLNTAPGWVEAGTSLSVDTNCAAFLDLSMVDEGEANLDLPSGTISLWFQANWTSTADSGSGPGDWASLLTVGQWTSNATASCWSLFIDPDGTNLMFLSQSNGESQVVLTAPIDFDAGDWHNVCVAYSDTNCCLYLEGQPITNAGPITYFPTDDDFVNYGAFVGSESSNGVFQARGQFQDLEAFNGPLSPDEIAQNYADMSAIILNAGGSLPSSGFGPDIDSPPDPGGGVTGGGSPDTSYQGPTYTVTTNYANYTNFWLTVTNNATNVYVTINSTLSNLTYAILTNTSIAGTNWQVWQILLASNSYTHAPPLVIGSTNLFFKGVLVWSITNSGLPDYWCMEYFKTLNIDPYADPDGDGLCNLDEFMLGTNPTNANSVTSLHNDAQALFLAYTNFDTNCRYALFVTNGPSGTMLVTLSNTLVGSNYQIYTRLQSDTNNTWIVETNFFGTNTETSVMITLGGRSLFFVGGYGEDSDGDGLPDGYEVLATLTDPLLPDTGLTGTPDGYKDPDGDGYVNLQEMYNGTNPHVFDTPEGPTNLIADIDFDGSVTFSWQAVSGPVTGYILSAYNNVTNGWTILATNSATELSYVLTNGADYDDGGYSALNILYTIKAVYAGGISIANYGGYNPIPALGQVILIHGPEGKMYMLASALTKNVIGYTAVSTISAGSYPESGLFSFPYDGSFPPDIPAQSNIDIPATQFTNGVAILSETQIPEWANIFPSYIYPQLTGNASGEAQGSLNECLAVPFIDGTQAMKQNIRFLLSAAGSNPFGYNWSDWAPPYTPYTIEVYDQNYVYSSYTGTYDGDFSLDHFAPFEDNYYFKNFIFDSSLVDYRGYMDTGFSPFISEWYLQTTNSYYIFPTYSYVANSNSAPIPGILPSNGWAGYFSGSISNFGAYSSGTNLLSMSSGATNCYGLPYDSLKLTLSNSGGIFFATLSPTSDVSGYSGLPFYAATASPDLQTVGYYFGLLAQPGFYYQPSGPQAYILPGSPTFSVTNPLPLLIGSVGIPMTIGGFAKQAILNGSPNAFAYLGQYFSNAMVISNGSLTTNSAGILSEYGEFLPTVPGQVALQTMPDPDQGNTNGTCVIDIIRLSLDVNHDGAMDETFTGQDNTGYVVPYVFWANNDYDRWTDSPLDGYVEDDIQPDNENPGSPFYEPPDCNYTVGYPPVRAIPCPRDLEDYARMWVSGISSNLLAALPSGSTVTLNWGDVGYPDTNNPTIDIFQAADSDGGTGYLTNLTTASNQINPAICKYIGRIGPGSNIVLNASTFSNNWAGDHYIWCGVANGSGQLSLTVTDGDDNLLAQSSQYIQIEDIKQMYERWTVGDNDDNKPVAEIIPLTNPTNVVDTQPAFHYPYDRAYDTNDDYILFVHGWNLPTWEKDRWAETMYKRLYWQGYQGRVGEFRWPTTQLGVVPPTYNPGEYIAWESSVGLKNLLTNLNGNYPGKVYVLAHSMGNVVTGEALRLAGTNIFVNTYVASQAAISARAYDNAIPADITNIFTLDGYSVKTPDSEGHYYTNGAPPYFTGIGGALHFVDYFNEGDWALNAWISDQADKPQLPYLYVGVSSSYPSGYIDTIPFQEARPLSFGTNTYEIFAMGTQSYSFALGAETNIAARFGSSINLQEDPFNFLRTHPGHSQQFRFDNMTTAAYWQQLLSSFGIQN
jgi:hypothetical protein